MTELSTDTSGLGSGGGGSSSVIGADGSYTPPGPGGGQQPFVAGDASALVNNKSPLEIASIQAVLAEAGVLRSNYSNGRAGPETISAYEEVLRLSNVQGAAPSVVLRNLSAANFARNLGASVGNAATQAVNGSGGGATRAPFTAQVTNSDDLREVFRNSVVELTGSNDTGIDVDAMVEAYQSVQKNTQAKAYNTAATGGTVEQAPSIETFARTQLEENAPQQVQSNDVVERAGQLFDMLGSFGGQ